MLLSTTAVLSAQETTPKAEVFGGYSYANIDNTFSSRRSNLNGWNGSLAVNVNRTFGIVADFSGHYALTRPTIGIACVINGNCTNFPVSNTHTFLFGPQVSFRTARTTPFVHALFGAAHSNISPSLASDTGFGTALGGGLDYTFTHLLAWRGQADYINTHLFGTAQHDFRLSTGLVFRFGGK
jgi:hypothetical protein